MFAGLFGKRRFRIERRDKVLFKRAARRFFVKRTAAVRTAHAYSTRTLKDFFLQRGLRESLSAMTGASAVPSYTDYGVGLRAALRRTVVRALQQRRFSRAKVVRAPRVEHPVSVGGVTTSLKKVSFKLFRANHRALTQLVRYATIDYQRTSKVLSPRYRAWQRRSVLLKLAAQRHLRSGYLMAKGFSHSLTTDYSKRQSLRNQLLSPTVDHLTGGAAPLRPLPVRISTKAHRNCAITGVGVISPLPPATATCALSTNFDRPFTSPVTAGHSAASIPTTFLTRVSALYPQGRNSAGLNAVHPSLGARVQRMYRARRLQSNQPKLRLPETSMTRRRCRRGGRGLFMQNTLKQPRTLVGRKNLFLPPNAAYSRHVSVYSLSQHRSGTLLLPPARQEDDKPRF